MNKVTVKEVSRNVRLVPVKNYIEVWYGDLFVGIYRKGFTRNEIVMDVFSKVNKVFS